MRSVTTRPERASVFDTGFRRRTVPATTEPAGMTTCPPHAHIVDGRRLNACARRPRAGMSASAPARRTRRRGNLQDRRRRSPAPVFASARRTSLGTTASRSSTCRHSRSATGSAAPQHHRGGSRPRRATLPAAPAAFVADELFGLHEADLGLDRVLSRSRRGPSTLAPTPGQRPQATKGKAGNRAPKAARPDESESMGVPLLIRGTSLPRWWLHESCPCRWSEAAARPCGVARPLLLDAAWWLLKR